MTYDAHPLEEGPPAGPPPRRSLSSTAETGPFWEVLHEAGTEVVPAGRNQ
jgi:hypothetical protein